MTGSGSAGVAQSYLQFLSSAKAPFLRPGLHIGIASRAVAVKIGRRPPPQAARSDLDGHEHGATLGQVGSACSQSVARAFVQI
jgi:hypothetical protein